MGLIKSAAELPVPSTLKMLIYGQPGMGKTTLAVSMPNCLILDFDRGAYRVNQEHLQNVDSVEVETWNDIEQVLQMDLRKYDTIVIDTAGKMIDAVIVACCGTRQPSIRDWSSINAKFKSFTVALNSLGKNQVYIAHRSERQQGENRVFVPDMREKNFSALSTDLDLIGYCVVKDVKGQKVRTLSFDSSDEHEGKNTCHLPSVMNIPEIVDRDGNVIGENNFLEEYVLKAFQANIAKKKQAGIAFSKLMDEIADKVNAIKTAGDADEFVKYEKGINHIGSSKERARQLFANKVNALGYKYDKDSGHFVDPNNKPEPKTEEKADDKKKAK